MNEPELLFAGRLFRVVRHGYHTADGAWHERETILHPGAAVILPMVDAQHVCLVRNYRHAVGKTLIELPAGTLEPGEAPQATAARELLEETGFRSARWERLAVFYMSPGILHEQMHLFLATELEPGQAQPGGGEQVEPLIVAWQEAVEMARDGRIEDAKSLVGILWYQVFRRGGS